MVTDKYQLLQVRVHGRDDVTLKHLGCLLNDHDLRVQLVEHVLEACRERGRHSHDIHLLQ